MGELEKYLKRTLPDVKNIQGINTDKPILMGYSAA
jgi:hypothetical protein